MKKKYLVGGLIIAILAGVLIGQSQGFVLAENEGEEIKIVNDLDEEESEEIKEAEKIEIVLDEEADLEEVREVKEEKTEVKVENKKEEVLSTSLSEKELFKRQMELAREEVDLALQRNILTEEQAKEELEYIDYLEENYDRDPASGYDDENYYNGRGYGHHSGGIHHRDGSCRRIDGERYTSNYNRGHHNGGCRRY